jgi:signal transduction histidine kinase
LLELKTILFFLKRLVYCIIMLMSSFLLAIVYFFYGLAFFCMGLIIVIEGGRAKDDRLRKGLRPLAVFGLIHGIHEWLEMFLIIEFMPGEFWIWESIRLALLAFSFLSLTACGVSLLSPTEQTRRLSLIVPLGQAAIWGFGLLYFRGQYTFAGGLWNVADVWTRYVIGIPGALIACAGLIHQQHVFRQAGMDRFGRDSLWAAVAFAWYGVIGQVFTRSSPLFPSMVLNQDLFFDLFGFPVQVLRAGAAIVVAIFVLRFMRSFEVETQRQIDELQAAQLMEAERREALKGEMLRQIVAAQEAERQRIGRELHDETGQSLTALGLGLRGVATNLRQDPDRAAHNLRQLEGMAAQSLDELRRLIDDLRPSHLDDFGLPAALRWYAGEVENRSGLNIRVKAPKGPCELPLQIKTALFRIAQEALTNVVKHAEARHVWITVERGDGVVRLDVRDDGRGFDRAQLPKKQRPAWGLMGMQERTVLCDGKFSLNSAPGWGTEIQVEIPCDDAVFSEEEKDEN